MPSHWNCFVAGCTNSYYTVKLNPQLELKGYRIPVSQRKFYNAFFKTDSVNWKYARICSQYWSTPRKNFKHLITRKYICFLKGSHITIKIEM